MIVQHHSVTTVVIRLKELVTDMYVHHVAQLLVVVKLDQEVISIYARKI